MPKTVLLECFNMGLARGTGIKTYATGLARIAHHLGFDVNGLFESSAPLSKKEPILAEVAFQENVRRANWRDKWLWDPVEIALGKPFGIPVQSLPSTGFVLRPDGGGKIGPFSRSFVSPRFTLSARRHFWRHKALARLRVDERPDLFHATHAVPVKVAGCPNIYTIHDVIPLRLPNATLDNKKFFLKSLRAICDHADQIVTVSECSKKDILSVATIPEDRITVTYQSTAFPAALVGRPAAETENIVANIFSLEPNGYFMFFGALEPKKNVSRLIDAYAASGVKAPLIIAGGLGWSFDGDVERINQEQFSSWRVAQDHIRRERKVRRFEHLPLSHLVALIKCARAVLFPSLYEGFGLPVLEAMSLGTPVMTSNVSSLPEVAGDAALMVDPYDLDAMTRAVVALDRDADLRADLAVKGAARAQVFSPEAYSERVSLLYRRMTGASAPAA